MADGHWPRLGVLGSLGADGRCGCRGGGNEEESEGAVGFRAGGGAGGMEGRRIWVGFVGGWGVGRENVTGRAGSEGDVGEGIGVGLEEGVEGGGAEGEGVCCA